MAKTKLRNLTQGAITLPGFNRILGPGSSIVTTGSVESVIATLGGGAAITTFIELTDVSDGQTADLDVTVVDRMIYGDGSSGIITVGAGLTVTLDQFTHATRVDIGIGGTLDTDGYPLLVNGPIAFADATGVIKSKTGLAGGAGTGAAAGAAAPTQTSINTNIRPCSVTFTGAAGVAGGAPGANVGVAGLAGLFNVAPVQGASGGAGTAAAGGVGGTPTDFWYPFKNFFRRVISLLSFNGSFNNIPVSVCTGGAGGGGAGTGAGGGGSGGHAYTLLVAAKSITGGGILRTVGGAGGAGFDNGGTGRGGGGGGGSAGSVFVIVPNGATANYVHSSQGGAGGAAGGAGAVAGAPGSSVGMLVELRT